MTGPMGMPFRALDMPDQPRLKLSSIVILGSLAGLPPLAIDLYLPALPSLTRGLHAAASSGQLTLTGFVAGLAFGQLVAGARSLREAQQSPTH